MTTQFDVNALTIVSPNVRFFGAASGGGIIAARGKTLKRFEGSGGANRHTVRTQFSVGRSDSHALPLCIEVKN